MRQGVCAHPDCDRTFETKSHKRRFCSRKCQQRVFHKQWRELKYKVCLCGREFREQRKYCSPECRMKYGKKRQGRPMRVAICNCCKQEFKRPAYWPGEMKFCSNKCAKKGTRRGQWQAALQNEDHVILFQSGYEIRFYAACLRFRVACRRYDGDDIETSVETYRPDFIVTIDGREVIVEVKGIVDEIVAKKVAESVEQGYDVLVLTEVHLKAFEEDGMLLGKIVKA